MDRLLRASHEGDIDSLYMTIQEHPTILEQIDATPFVNTPLHIAASAGHIEYAMEIARLKPSFAWKPNQQGSTPIHVALEQNQTNIVLGLLDIDAKLVRVKGREGVTPLHYVVQKGELDILEKFLERVGKAIMDLTIRKETVFHLASKNDQIKALDLLFEKIQNLELEESAKILNFQDLKKNTILHLAADANQDHVVKLLLKWDKSSRGKLQIGAANQNGKTALEIATAHEHRSIERLLRCRQHEINCCNIYLTLKKVFRSALRIAFISTLFESFYGKTASEKIRSNLLVVATLMAAVTFQVVLQPPGGLSDKNGYAKLSDSDYDDYENNWPLLYSLIMYSNTFAFVVSITTILLLIGSFPMSWTFYAAAIAMVFTYCASLVAITKDGLAEATWLCIVTPILVLLVLLMFYGGVIKRWLFSGCKPKRKAASAGANVV